MFSISEEETHKIVVNENFGGFGLSEEAHAYLEKQPEVIELRKQNPDFNIDEYFWMYENRTNPALVRCVETLGEKSGRGSSELKVKTIEGNQYRIRDYDGLETVETPNNLHWLEVQPDKKNFNNSDNRSQNEEGREKLNISKISFLMNKNEMTAPDRLQKLYEFTQENTSSTVLSVAIMQAENLSFYPKSQEQEDVNPPLVPYTMKIINGALCNPNCDINVLEVSSHTLNAYCEQQGVVSDTKLQKQIDDLIGIINNKKKSNEIQNKGNNPNIDANTARVVCATFYMGARGMDFVKDPNGNTLLLPKYEGKSLPERISELQNKNSAKKTNIFYNGISNGI